ncbi:MAG TPA: IclR family transcriptional regulator C-terminal domain-containing protein [Acetobacteraceae bacterium]|jgi:DNA-binding IclR family transcriptional regulator|nr:IclR family transcriptional regulator C-terminal domain-containing protein [Acetobacteraceae bacterium]HEX4369580.1 IclR family transcriptional regulator C-terminal domain-containing protein [Rhodopila sp.]
MDNISPPEHGRAAGETSITRVLGILDLFTPETPVWTVDLLVDRLLLGRATIYRYVRALCDAGFLVPVAGAGYVLGPRFIEFDRSIRLADPLLHIVPPVMAELRDVVNGGQLLCAFYGLRVLTVLQDKTDPNITMSMERGRPFSLFRGSPSRVILANLPTYQLRNLALNHQQDIAEAGLGQNWTEFRDAMRTIRRNGYLVASDIDKALVGISAPIFHAPGAVAASLCLVRTKQNVSPEDATFLGRLAVDACRRISSELQAFRPGDADFGAPAFPISRVR